MESERNNCIQRSVPTVDNTCMECDEFVSDACVYIKNGHRSIKPGKDIPLREYLSKIGDTLKDLKYNLGKVASATTGRALQKATAVSVERRLPELNIVEGDTLDRALDNLDKVLNSLKIKIDAANINIEGNKKFSKIVSDKNYKVIGAVLGDSLSKVIDLVESKLSSLMLADTETTSKFSDVEDKIQGQSNRIDAVNKRISDLDPRFKGIAQSVENLRNFLGNFDYKKVVFTDSNSYLGIVRGDNLSDLVNNIEIKFNDMEDAIGYVASDFNKLKTDVSKTSAITVDRGLYTMGTKSGAILSDVLTVMDRKINNLETDGASNITISNPIVSDEAVLLSDLIVKMYQTLQDVSKKQEVLKEQYTDLKEQVNILRKNK